MWQGLGLLTGHCLEKVQLVWSSTFSCPPQSLRCRVSSPRASAVCRRRAEHLPGGAIPSLGFRLSRGPILVQPTGREAAPGPPAPGPILGEVALPFVSRKYSTPRSHSVLPVGATQLCLDATLNRHSYRQERIQGRCLGREAGQRWLECQMPEHAWSRSKIRKACPTRVPNPLFLEFWFPFPYNHDHPLRLPMFP